MFVDWAAQRADGMLSSRGESSQAAPNVRLRSRISGHDHYSHDMMIVTIAAAIGDKL